MRLRQRDVVMREIDGETVLLDLAGSAYFAINEAGTVLLRLLGSEQDRAALVSALVSEFGISTELASADADAFVSALDERGLLV